MKRVIFALFVFFLAFADTAIPQSFTRHAEVSLLTCSSGEELYSTFGHSAIRVNDTVTGKDIVFNYGVFDFNTPHFYWKFIRGKLKYQLAIQYTDSFIRAYKSEGRSVREEKLRLKQAEKMKLIQFLRINYLPANRYYLYDFFYNNCSSKIWDAVKKTANGDFRFDQSNYKPTSFRVMLYPSLEDMDWSRFGIDILLGTPADQIANFEEQMFLPEYLSDNMSHTYKTKVDGSRKMLLGPSILLVPERKEKDKQAGISPLVLFYFLLTAVLLLTLLVKRSKVLDGLDYLFFSGIGLLGLLLVFMWFGTDHQAMSGNYNLLWANPLGIIFLFLVNRKKYIVKKVIMTLLGLSLFCLLIGWSLIPQHFNPAFLPLALIMTVRLTDHIFRDRFNTSIANKLRQIQ